MDREFNFVLGMANEFHNAENGLTNYFDIYYPLYKMILIYIKVDQLSSTGTVRKLGMTMIPGKHIVSCSVLDEIQNNNSRK